MAIILRGPYDPGYTRDRSFKGAYIGYSRYMLALSKDEGRTYTNLVLRDALRVPQDEVFRGG